MNARAGLTAALLLAVSAIPGSAQTVLTIDDAVRATLANNPSLRAADLMVEEARQQAAHTRSSFLPRVVFTETWQRSDAPVFVFSSLLSARRFTAEDFALASLNHPQPVTLFRSALGIEQVWFDGGRRRAALRGATAGVEDAGAARDQQAAGLAVAATETFGRILEAEARERAAQAAISAADEDLSRATRQRDLGLATDADVLAVSVHRADLEQRAIQASGDAAVARAGLNRLMGAPIATDYSVAEPLDHLVSPARPLAEVLSAAKDQRPEVLRASLQETIAAAERRRAAAAFLPTIATQAQVDLSGATFGHRASSWAAGGELRWSLSLGGAERAAVSAGDRRLARARAELDDVRGAVEVDVVTAYRRLETARARVAAGQSAVTQAREQQRIIRDRFDAGLAGVNDVLQVSAALLAAEANRIAAVVDAMVGRAALMKATGRISQ